MVCSIHSFYFHILSIFNRLIGTFRLVTPKRVNKKTAHKGAVLCVRWSWDGSQLATSGEDGIVMIWSKTGEGSQAAKTENPVFAVSWSPSDDQIVFCTFVHPLSLFLNL